MPSIEIKVTENTVPELASSAARLLKPRMVNQNMADAGTVLTQAHLSKVSNERDSGSRFYEKFSNVTHSEASETVSKVVIPPTVNKSNPEQRGNPLAAHFWGYDFTQANLTDSKFYAIPANDETRYRRAREFPDLMPIFSLIGGLHPFALIQKQSSPLKYRKTKSGGSVSVKTSKIIGGKIMFWLIRGFKLKGGSGVGDKSVLPTETEYTTAGTKAVEDLISRVQRRQA